MDLREVGNQLRERNIRQSVLVIKVSDRQNTLQFTGIPLFKGFVGFVDKLT